jgi:hypothetical protein
VSGARRRRAVTSSQVSDVAALDLLLPFRLA